MVIGPNFVFIAVPRTASNTMARLFLPQFGGVSNHRQRRHHERIVPKAHEHKFTFAVVRNPYDRMLSCYYHLSRNDRTFGIRDMTMPQFMRFLIAGWGEGGWCQTRFLADARIDVHLPYEDLANAVERLPFAPGAELPTERLNVARGRPAWREDLRTGVIDADDDLEIREFIALVNEHSREDFDAYGYERLAA